ncbi:MAG: YabP/YqfC family sporulation protein, partial [Clostridiales bacterium]|nr:YabP/YqfC family sporulation protein [Clostridiales bacterium]
MEEKSGVKPHSISWKDRAEGSVTGVTDVLSFDEGSVVLQT